MSTEELLTLLRQRLCLRHTEKSIGYYETGMTHSVSLVLVDESGTEEVLDTVSFDIPARCRCSNDGMY